VRATTLSLPYRERAGERGGVGRLHHPLPSPLPSREREPLVHPVPSPLVGEG
jgi:hypothetical protein